MNGQEQKIINLEGRLADLESRFDSHQHNGIDNQVINFDDLIGAVRTVTTSAELGYVTALSPTNPASQIFIYVNGATKRLYIYDYTSNAISSGWMYTTLT